MQIELFLLCCTVHNNHMWIFYKKYVYTVVTNIKRNDCRLLRNGIYISKKERRRKLFRFNLVTTVCKLKQVFLLDLFTLLPRTHLTGVRHRLNLAQSSSEPCSIIVWTLLNHHQMEREKVVTTNNIRFIRIKGYCVLRIIFQEKQEFTGLHKCQEKMRYFLYLWPEKICSNRTKAFNPWPINPKCAP